MDELEQQNNPDQNKPEPKIIRSKISPYLAAFIGLFGSFALYQIVGGGITLLIFGTDLNSAPVNSMRLMQMAGQILFLLLPALIFTKAIYEDVTEVLRVRLPELQDIIFFSIGILVLTPLLQYFLYIQNYYIAEWAKSFPFVHSVKSVLDSMNDMMDSAYANLLKANNLFDAILIILVVSVIPALSEETLFRGFIQKSFEFKLKPVWAALFTAIFFGLFHFNPYGLIPLIALGFYFGFAAYTTNSIFVPMILHFLNNFAAIIIYFLVGDEDLIKSAPVPDSSELKSTVFMFFIFLVLFIAVIAFIKRYYSKYRTN